MFAFFLPTFSAFFFTCFNDYYRGSCWVLISEFFVIHSFRVHFIWFFWYAVKIRIINRTTKFIYIKKGPIRSPLIQKLSTNYLTFVTFFLSNCFILGNMVLISASVRISNLSKPFAAALFILIALSTNFCCSSGVLVTLLRS